MVRRVTFADESSSSRPSAQSEMSSDQRQTRQQRHPPASRRPRRRRTCTIAGLPPVAVILLFFHVALFAAISFVPPGFISIVAEAREIVATSEWQKLSENDTVPAGLHVKIDITTGEKWAKLPSDDDADDEEATKGTVYDANINADGSVSATAVAVTPSEKEEEEEEGNAPANSSSNNNQEGQQQDATSYDYEMMHRTLSKLPDDEMERYGGLPALPGGSNIVSGRKITLEERKAFEDRMASIWKQRQEEIQNMQEEFMADMPKMLLQRVKFVKAYLENPSEHRAALVEERQQQQQSSEADDGYDADDEGDENIVSDIVAVLKDLEYHVSDVDHARDYHTLGGWPVLVSLLTDAVHYPPLTTTENSTTIPADVDRSIVEEIQSAAAWAIGTAVKNHEEFHSWALEDLSQAFDPPPSEPVTVLSLLLSNIEAYTADDTPPLSTTAQSKRQRCLYALGSLVRGNPAATQHFLDLNGPGILASSLQQIMSIDNINTANAKFASKILGLGDDLLGDVLINGNSDAETDGNQWRLIIDSLTTRSWCEAAVGLASKGFTSLQIRERSLMAMKSMAPYCQFSQDDRRAVQQIGAELHGSDGELAQLETEIKAEFVTLVDSILEIMDKLSQ